MVIRHLFGTEVGNFTGHPERETCLGSDEWPLSPSLRALRFIWLFDHTDSDLEARTPPPTPPHLPRAEVPAPATEFPPQESHAASAFTLLMEGQVSLMSHVCGCFTSIKVCRHASGPEIGHEHKDFLGSFFLSLRHVSRSPFD